MKLSKEEKQKIHNLVYNFPTKNKIGFVDKEQEDLLSNFPGIDLEEFNSHLMGITCQKDEKLNQFIIYHDDIYTAIICTLENRQMNIYEFD